MKVEEKLSQTHPEHMQESDRLPLISSSLPLDVLLLGTQRDIRLSTSLREGDGRRNLGRGGHECSIQLSSD